MDQACFFCGATPIACQISVPVGFSLAFRSACHQGGDSPDPAWRQNVLKEVMAAPTSRVALASGSKTPPTGVCAECRLILEEPATAPVPEAQPIRGKSGGCAVVVAIALAVLIGLGVASFPGDRNPVFRRETGAIVAIRILNKAQVLYRLQYGEYASSLTELGTPGRGVASPGYQFTLARTMSGYTIHANPIHVGTDGYRTFFSDQSMVIRQNFGPEPATLISPELG